MERKWFQDIRSAVESYERVIVCEREGRAAKRLRGLLEGRRIRLMELGPDEMKEFDRLYRLYEFSDRLCVVCETEQYGSLLNYVRTGLLSEEEYYETLLY